MFGQQQFKLTVDQDWPCFAQSNQLTVVVKQRVFVRKCLCGIHFREVVVDCQPRLSCGEARLRITGPLHRGSGIVATLGVNGLHHLLRVLSFLGHCNMKHVARFNVLVGVNVVPFDIGHSQFFTLVDEGCALHHVQTSCQHFAGANAKHAIVTKARDGSGLIVIAPVQTVPTFAMQSSLPMAQTGFQIGQVQRLQRPLAFAWLAVDVHVLKLKHHVQSTCFSVRDGLCLFNCGARRFTNSDAIVVVQNFTPHFVHKVHQAGAMRHHLKCRLQKSVLNNRCIGQSRQRLTCRVQLPWF